MFKRCAAVVLALVCVFVVAPAHAATSPVTLPTVKPLASGHLDFAIKVNSDLLAYGQAEFMGTNIHAAAVDATSGGTIEAVVLGNHVYLRQNREVRWLGLTVKTPAVPASSPAMPVLPSSGFTVSLQGDATVGTTATSQYQIQIDPTAITAAAGAVPGVPAPSTTQIKSAKLDLFIGKADGNLYKAEITEVIVDPKLGEQTLDLVLVVSAFNQRFVIGAPPAALVDETQTMARVGRPAAGAGLMPLWAQPFFAQRSHATAAHR